MILSSTLFATLIQQLASLSSNQGGLGNDDFFTYANLLMEKVVKEILKTREEYLMFTDTIPIVAGQASYRIPYRSVDGRLRHLWFEDQTGQRRPILPDYFENIESYSSNDRDAPTRFYISSNSVVFLPAPTTSTGNLVCVYPFRPNLMVDALTTTTVMSVDYPSNTITVPSVPLNFVSGSLFDLIEHRSGNNILNYDTVGTISGTTITFDEPIPNVIDGNYVAPAGTSPVFMIPECAQTLLLEHVILRIQEIRGNALQVKASMQRVKDELDTCVSLLSSRVVSKPPVVGGGNPQLPRRF